jgi:hypothetical protein
VLSAALTLVAFQLSAGLVVVQVRPHVSTAGHKAPLLRAEAGRLHTVRLAERLYWLQSLPVPESHLSPISIFLMSPSQGRQKRNNDYLDSKLVPARQAQVRCGKH